MSLAKFLLLNLFGSLGFDLVLSIKEKVTVMLKTVHFYKDGRFNIIIFNIIIIFFSNETKIHDTNSFSSYNFNIAKTILE